MNLHEEMENFSKDHERLSSPPFFSSQVRSLTHLSKTDILLGLG